MRFLYLPNTQFKVGSCYQGPVLPMQCEWVGRKVATLMAMQPAQFTNTFSVEAFATLKSFSVNLFPRHSTECIHYLNKHIHFVSN